MARQKLLGGGDDADTTWNSGRLWAATGYATNSLAINMLFKRYFGCLGGFIEKHHESFVENLAALVERDLIKHATLA